MVKPPNTVKFHIKALARLVFRTPRKLNEAAKPFLVNLYLKVEWCSRLKRLV